MSHSFMEPTKFVYRISFHGVGGAQPIDTMCVSVSFGGHLYLARFYVAQFMRWVDCWHQWALRDDMPLCRYLLAVMIGEARKAIMAEQTLDHGKGHDEG